MELHIVLLSVLIILVGTAFLYKKYDLKNIQRHLILKYVGIDDEDIAEINDEIQEETTQEQPDGDLHNSSNIEDVVSKVDNKIGSNLAVMMKKCRNDPEVFFKKCYNQLDSEEEIDELWDRVSKHLDLYDDDEMETYREEIEEKYNLE